MFGLGLQGSVLIKKMNEKLLKKIENVNKELIKSHSVIAITGQIASGKNFVCSQFEKFGWNCVDADYLTHEAINIAAPKIIEEFKRYEEQFNVKITNEDGSINRRAIGNIVFARPELLAKQEEIVYPIITKMAEDFISAHGKVIINATVLHKTPILLDRCQAIVYIKSPVLKRIFRIRRRDNLPYRQIFKRLKSQRNLLSKYKITGKQIIVIKN